MYDELEELRAKVEELEKECNTLKDDLDLVRKEFYQAEDYITDLENDKRELEEEISENAKDYNKHTKIIKGLTMHIKAYDLRVFLKE